MYIIRLDNQDTTKYVETPISMAKKNHWPFFICNTPIDLKIRQKTRICTMHKQ